MRLNFFFILLCLISFYGNSQIYSALVIDEDGKPLKAVVVEDTTNQYRVTTNEEGRFFIPFIENSYLKFSQFNYETRYLSPPNFQDTIQLIKDTRLLESVEISSSRIKKVMDRPNINVLDYHVFKDSILILYAERGRKFLTMERTFGTNTVVSIGQINGKSLVMDCFENIHLCSNQKAYRLGLSNQISFVAECDLNEFESVIEPCKAIMDSHLMIGNYTDHRQKYTLAIKRKPEPQFSPFFTIFDEEKYSACNELYWEIVATYMASVDTVTNIILNKMWDGKNMRALAETYDLVVLIGFFEGVAAQPLNVYTFQSNDQLLVFDLCFDSVYVFDHDAQLISSANLQYDKGPNNAAVMMDRFNQSFYLTQQNKGIYQFRKIDPNNGSLSNSIEFSEAIFPEKIQIFNNTLYFLTAQNGFHKLYRYALPRDTN